MASAAFENPLIPHPRLRQLYRAMMQLRTVGKALPAKARGGWVAGMEAVLAATSLDLTPSDLVSDAFSGGAMRLLRGAALGEALGGGNGPGKKTLDCGAASPLQGSLPVEERLWAALGAAGALKVQAEDAKKTAAAGGEEGAPPESKVAVVYVQAGEVSPLIWRRLLSAAAEQVLPLIVIVLPSAGASSSDAPVSALALRSGVPGIPVDASDAVAIYRVMQESLVRARMGGGAALIECVPFVLAGATGKNSRPADAVETIAHYMLTRNVVSRAWLAGEASGFARRVELARSRK